MSLTEAQVQQMVRDALDERLKPTRHENADHLDRALLARKIKPSTTDADVLYTDAGDAKWGAPHIAKSLLTTRGDIIRRGASAPERVALGALGSALMSDGTDATWRTQAQRFKIGTFTISATGSKVVTGVGFKPGYVEFAYLPASSGSNTAMGRGAMDSAGNQWCWIGAIDDGVGASQNSATDGCIGLPASFTAGTFNTKAAFTSMDSDGFTINVGTHVSGTFSFAYMAHA